MRSGGAEGRVLRESLRRLIFYLHDVIEMHNCKHNLPGIKKGSHKAMWSQRKYVFS